MSGAALSALEIATRLGLHAPTPEQRAVIEADPHGQSIVVAGAGSGKTETMANRVVWLLANGHVEVPEVLGLTCGVILEEGFPLEALARVQRSLEEACREAGVRVVTGDTKVMGKGELDGIVINTSGVGLTRRVVRDSGLHPGDRIVVTGTLGDHGLAVLACRNQLRLGDELRSDTAPLNDLLRTALAAVGDAIVALKDPTRGGLASTLHEMAGTMRSPQSSPWEASPARDSGGPWGPAVPSSSRSSSPWNDDPVQRSRRGPWG